MAKGTLLSSRYLLGAVQEEREWSARFRATDVSLGRAVLIKVPGGTPAERDAVARLFDRACDVSASRLGSLPWILDYGTTPDGSPYYVLEEPQAPGPLRQRTGGPLPAAKVAGFARDLARALGAAHACGVLHLELAPERLQLAHDRDGAEVARLGDFGIPRDRARSACPALPYAAPELLVGAAGTELSDVYALGAVVYELLSGERPFGESRQPGAGEPPGLAARHPGLQVSAALEAVVSRALCATPAGRFGSMEELAAALVAALASDQETRRLAARATPAAAAPAAMSPAVMSPAAMSRAATPAAILPAASVSAATWPATTAPAAPAAPAAHAAPTTAPIRTRAPAAPRRLTREATRATTDGVRDRLELVRRSLQLRLRGRRTVGAVAGGLAGLGGLAITWALVAPGPSPEARSAAPAPSAAAAAPAPSSSPATDVVAQGQELPPPVRELGSRIELAPLVPHDWRRTNDEPFPPQRGPTAPVASPRQVVRGSLPGLPPRTVAAEPGGAAPRAQPAERPLPQPAGTQAVKPPLPQPAGKAVKRPLPQPAGTQAVKPPLPRPPGTQAVTPRPATPPAAPPPEEPLLDDLKLLRR